MVKKWQIGPLRVIFIMGRDSPRSSENTRISECLLCVSICLLLVMQRPPVLPPALVDTEALSQGCSSALLFRDNDKALNPSVDLTFVPASIFKLSCAFKSCALAGARRIRCMFGQRWLQEPPSVWFGNPATTTQLPAKPRLIYQIPKIIMRCLLWMGGKSEEKRKEKSKVYFCLRRTLRVWSSVTQTCYRCPFKFDRDVYIQFPLLNCYQRPVDWDHDILHHIFKQYLF